MDNKSTIETYEDKKQSVSVFNLTSDLFAGKVFEDVSACQELCRILLHLCESDIIFPALI